MDSTLQNKLRQVQALLDRAEHPNTPPAEAESARAMADKLMAKYRIDEENIRQTKLAAGADDIIKPVVDEFSVCSYDSEYRDHYASLMSQCCWHVGNIKVATKYDNGQYIFIMVGFESDVKYAQTLYTSLRLHFANTLEPTYNSEESDKENVYRMRSAGLERGRIGRMIWGPDGGKRHLEVGRLYKEACADRGEDATVSGRGTNAKTYRKSFADGYVGRIRSRLYQMQTMAGQDSRGLMLAGREEAVNEAFYERFPQFRPITREDRMIGEGSTGGPGGNCAKCNKTQSGYCRDHRWMKPSSARARYKASSAAGSMAGRRSADSADIGGNKTGRIGS
jgi:hypothetical protein